jgi:hypothetical protein
MITLNYIQVQQLTVDDRLTLSPFFSGLRVSSFLLWLTWFWFTNRSLLLRTTNDERRLHSDWITIHNLLLFYEWITTDYVSPLITPGRTEYRSVLPTVHVIRCLSVAAETRVNSIVRPRFLQAYPMPLKRVLVSRCLAMDYSGFQASCHSIITHHIIILVYYYM